MPEAANNRGVGWKAEFIKDRLSAAGTGDSIRGRDSIVDDPPSGACRVAEATRGVVRHEHKLPNQPQNESVAERNPLEPAPDVADHRERRKPAGQGHVESSQ